MRMNSINELIVDSAAPFNREERFFTGTVLSLLFSGNDFRNLKVITDIMAPKLKLTPIYSVTDKNVLFYTEYNLKKSRYVTGEALAIAEDVDGDTPDVLFYVSDENVTYIFAIEVKMYHRPTSDNLALQMQRQQVILKNLADRKNIPYENIFHAALLPEKHPQQRKGTPSIFTWEDLLKEYTKINANNYAIDILRYALEHYAQLVSKQSTGKKNNTGKYTGQRIVADHQLLNIKYVGCGGGLNGLEKHVENNTWRNFPFEVIQEDKNVSVIVMPKVNWFTINDFLFTTGNKAAEAAN